jgi:hypothetical protein
LYSNPKRKKLYLSVIMDIDDFINKYCILYGIKEDDFTSEDVQFIETVYWDYIQSGKLPDYMKKVGVINGY